uniref:esterase-like activity of phytase family protein n=1 Tax=Edaphosphingomonas laterariae TaxID=861865 RepID=UPI000B7962F6|nr:esterase-like activity of phytase family protein [Sphingomonas laterariae]
MAGTLVLGAMASGILLLGLMLTVPAAKEAVVTQALTVHSRLFDSPHRQPRAKATVPVRYRAIALPPLAAGPLKLAGAWKVEADEPRFGGISALALDGASLLALADTGVVIRLPRPGAKSTDATLWDLPGGPGSPRIKEDRDSEAIAADPLGRGWWVAFENRDQLWLYDRTIHHPLARIEVHDPALAFNYGIEALAPMANGLLLLPEAGQSAIALAGHRRITFPVSNGFGAVSEAAALPDGSLLLLARIVRLRGFENRLVRLVRHGDGFETELLAQLPIGRYDNIEAMAAEPAGDGRTRIWLMTDNDLSLWRSTLLVLLEMAPMPPATGARSHG